MSVFGRTVDTFIAHWPTFVALTLPSVLVSLISLLVAASRSATATAVQPIDLLALLYIPIGIFVTTSIAMATDDVHAGRNVSALAVLGPAVGRAGVALVSAIVVWLVVIGLLLIPLILFSVAAIAGGAGGTAIGLIILLILGAVAFYGLFRWAFAPTAIAIDRAGPLSGLNRSWKLTRGNLWRLGVLVIGIALVTAPWSIAGSVLVFADKTLAGAVVGVVGTLLFGALASIVVTIAYGDVTGRWRASQVAAEAHAASGPEWWAGVTPATSSERLGRDHARRTGGRRRGDAGARRVGRSRRRRCTRRSALSLPRRPPRVPSPASPAPSAGSTSLACSSSAASC